MTEIYLIEYISLTAIKAIVSPLVIYLVICRWRRKEAFLTCVPILLLLSEIDQIITNADRLDGDENFTHKQFILNVLNQYVYNCAHWIFVVQYLQTCNILPYMLEDARVSLELDEFEQGHVGGA